MKKLLIIFLLLSCAGEIRGKDGTTPYAWAITDGAGFIIAGENLMVSHPNAGSYFYQFKIPPFNPEIIVLCTPGGQTRTFCTVSNNTSGDSSFNIFIYSDAQSSFVDLDHNVLVMVDQ